jgi:hypothetical protein
MTSPSLETTDFKFSSETDELSTSGSAALSAATMGATGSSAGMKPRLL